MQSSQLNFLMQKSIFNRYIYYSKKMLKAIFIYSLENGGKCSITTIIVGLKHYLIKRDIPKPLCKKATQNNMFISIVNCTPTSFYNLRRNLRLLTKCYYTDAPLVDSRLQDPSVLFTGISQVSNTICLTGDRYSKHIC